jgi:hypothetical protein
MAPKGQTVTHERQPMHLSWFTITLLSFSSREMALTGQMIMQGASWHCWQDMGI